MFIIYCIYLLLIYWMNKFCFARFQVYVRYFMGVRLDGGETGVLGENQIFVSDNPHHIILYHTGCNRSHTFSRHDQ